MIEIIALKKIHQKILAKESRTDKHGRVVTPVNTRGQPLTALCNS